MTSHAKEADTWQETTTIVGPAEKAIDPCRPQLCQITKPIGRV
jgi:hypothetical protein